MILLLFILGIAALIGGYITYHSEKKPSGRYDDATKRESIGTVTGIIGGITAALMILPLIPLTIAVINQSVIDEKIAMYQEENTKIEEQVATAVQGFQDHESKVFENATAESAITLVSLYPELKSDTLVQSQIEIYVENNEKIKELKEKKINGDVYRWWLYFGGK